MSEREEDGNPLRQKGMEGSGGKKVTKENNNERRDWAGRGVALATGRAREGLARREANKVHVSICTGENQGEFRFLGQLGHLQCSVVRYFICGGVLRRTRHPTSRWCCK